MPKLNSREIQNLLQSLRRQALAEGEDELGSHQLDAHWSLAYACGQAPEPWEIYRVPSLHLLPSTDFYLQHATEIKAALEPVATWTLLEEHALPKLALAAQMTDQECKSHGYPGKVQFYDRATTRWESIDLPAVRWFDSRDIFRASLLETRDDLRAKVIRNLARYKAAAIKDPTPKRLETLAGYERFAGEGLSARLQRFDAEKADIHEWLSKVDQTPDFRKTLFTLLRHAENQVRQTRGVAAVGEGWVSETELLYRVRGLLPGIEVIAHGQPKWLGRQHLDIWIPSLNVAIEYHGPQHFRPIEFFGGNEAFQRGQERDRRKRELCERNRVRLVEIAYDEDMDDTELRTLVTLSDTATSCTS